ncbi:DUF3127 domain-containing protein, partial [Patescibacteria group bacterium]|nr:DUF3127 domain-containing protein [Patescibacteria group bacterium]
IGNLKEWGKERRHTSKGVVIRVPEGKYNTEVMIEFQDEDIKMLNNLALDDTVLVLFKARSNAYIRSGVKNWFTTLIGLNISKFG